MSDQQKRSGPIRISDVARLAGVSAATVSRVLSRPGMVAEHTREAVLRAVRESGYRMNHAARNLRKQRTGAVVALVPNLGNPFFAPILAGLGRTLERAGYDLLVADTRSDGGHRRALRRFLDPSRADGIVLLDGLVDPGDLAEVEHAPPIVMACEWIESVRTPRVVFDNAAGTGLAARHLSDHGHTRIACIGGPEGNVLHLGRIEGVAQVLGHGAFTVFQGDFTLEAGKAAAQSWLSLPKDQRPTGIISFSDEMACAFIGEVQRRGISVPQEVSVVGFDDIEMVKHMSPPLTTIRQPKRHIGQQAAETILALIEGQAAPEMILIAPQIMIRDSTGPAPR